MVIVYPPHQYSTKPETFSEWLKIFGQALLDHGLANVKLVPLREPEKLLVVGVECAEAERQAVAIAAEQSAALFVTVAGREPAQVREAAGDGA